MAEENNHQERNNGNIVILSLTNKTTYALNSNEAKGVLAAIEAGERYAIVQGDYIMLNAIIAIQDDEKLSEAEHIRNGDYRCAHGYWHTKHDVCHGHDPKLTRVGAIHTERQLEADHRSEQEQYEAARGKAEQIRQRFNW